MLSSTNTHTKAPLRLCHRCAFLCACSFLPSFFRPAATFTHALTTCISSHTHVCMLHLFSFVQHFSTLPQQKTSPYFPLWPRMCIDGGDRIVLVYDNSNRSDQRYLGRTLLASTAAVANFWMLRPGLVAHDAYTHTHTRTCTHMSI